MQRDGDQDTTMYKVVLDHEEQYSMWPSQLASAPGWSDVGMQGTTAGCVAHIEQVWVNMRPSGLRRAVASTAAS